MILANAWIVTMDDAGSEHVNGWLEVEDGRIAAVGSGDPPTPGEDETIVDQPDVQLLPGDPIRKIYVDGVGARIIAERVEYLDENGKLVTESLRDFTKAALKKRFVVFYDEKGAVGRRYRRQDEAGTPFGITIDGQTLQDQTVTVRDRDTLQQERVPADRLAPYLAERLTR